jgi:thiol:disulfide interchange protein DsbD
MLLIPRFLVVCMTSSCAVCRRVSAAIVIQLLAAASGMAAPRQVSAPHLTVELLADQATIVPGKDLWLGIRFALEPGWHIYWQNPGDSGGPPTVGWKLPAGLAAGPIEWPAPERIEVPPLVNYGYDGDVVLPVRISAANRQLAGDVRLAATVKWLVCRDLCLSGRADVELPLPLPPELTGAVPGWKKLLSQALGKVPRAAPASWKAEARSEGDNFVVSVQTGRREAGGVFFPLDEDQIDDSAPQKVEPFAEGVRFTLRKSNRLLTAPAALRGVISLPGARAFVVSAPLDAKVSQRRTR